MTFPVHFRKGAQKTSLIVDNRTFAIELEKRCQETKNKKEKKKKKKKKDIPKDNDDKSLPTNEGGGDYLAPDIRAWCARRW